MFDTAILSRFLPYVAILEQALFAVANVLIAFALIYFFNASEITLALKIIAVSAAAAPLVNSAIGWAIIEGGKTDTVLYTRDFLKLILVFVLLLGIGLWICGLNYIPLGIAGLIAVSVFSHLTRIILLSQKKNFRALISTGLSVCVALILVVWNVLSKNDVEYFIYALIVSRLVLLLATMFMSDITLNLFGQAKIDSDSKQSISINRSIAAGVVYLRSYGGFWIATAILGDVSIVLVRSMELCLTAARQIFVALQNYILPRSLSSSYVIRIFCIGMIAAIVATSALYYLLVLTKTGLIWPWAIVVVTSVMIAVNTFQVIKLRQLEKHKYISVAMTLSLAALVLLALILRDFGPLPFLMAVMAEGSLFLIIFASIKFGLKGNTL